MRGKTCSRPGIKSGFLRLLHISISFSRHLHALWPSPADQSHLGCMHVLCIFVCLVVYVQTSAVQLETTRLTYICPHVLYIWCSVTYRKAFPQSPQALHITYLRSALPYDYSLMVNWTEDSTAVTLQQRRVYKRFSCLSVFPQAHQFPTPLLPSSTADAPKADSHS